MNLKLAFLLVVVAVLAAVEAGYYRGHGKSPSPISPQSSHHHYYGQVHNHYGLDKDEEHHDDDHHDDDHHGRHSKHHDHDEHEEEDEKKYRFQMGENFGAYEYIDRDGYLRGFSIDLLLAVCNQAGKTCHYTVDKYDHCWDTKGGNEYPGIGLMDNWYDGCVGLFPSPERLNAFNFTLPYTIDIRAGLFFKEGTEIDDGRNITGKKIGFVDGWVVSKRCLNRQQGFTGNEVGSYTPVNFETHTEMVAAINKGEVDAGVTVDAIGNKVGLKAEGHWFKCTNGGASVMTRYGDEVLAWWNQAFDELRDNGGYARLCEEAAIKHGHRGKIHCIE